MLDDLKNRRGLPKRSRFGELENGSKQNTLERRCLGSPGSRFARNNYCRRSHPVTPAVFAKRDDDVTPELARPPLNDIEMPYFPATARINVIQTLIIFKARFYYVTSVDF